MPIIHISNSPLIPSTSPVEIHYREWGTGIPLVFLHGGWGYQIYHFQRQVEVFGDRFRIVAPDRSGYGGSARIDDLPSRFHQAAAEETFAVLEALGIERPIIWGHSDGSVIAAIMGLMHPERISGVILEAFHYDRKKPGSKEFFENMVVRPELFGDRVCATLAQDHGDEYWRTIIAADGRAWLKIIEESADPEADLYQGRLGELSVPTLFIHGGRDPRTEPDELDSVRRLLPECRMSIIEGAGHSPHSSSNSFTESNRAANEFLASLLLCR